MYLKPQYILGNELQYRYTKESSFFAGNEYNYFENRVYDVFDGITSSGLFTTSFSVNIDADGRNLGGSPAINGADPSIEYYDLDLTRGDAGAYGGSHTIDNYFPLTTGSSRVYEMTGDRGVFQGYNLSIKAAGFDK